MKVVAIGSWGSLSNPA